MKPVPIALITYHAKYYKNFTVKKDINTGNTGRQLNLYKKMYMRSLQR